MDTRYITSASKPEQLPPYELPEIAFIGRSNTGKSSLLNTLLGRRNLARESRTPGRTRMVNFFGVNDCLILADLPGYGYSEAHRSVTKTWQPLMNAYVERPNIKEFLFLLDCRRDLTDVDLELMFFMSKQLPLQVVLTKVDKLSRSEVISKTKIIRGELEAAGIAFQEIYPTSTLKGQGIKELKEALIQPHMAQESRDGD